ncbi:type I restriction endonuclease subunit R [Acinetobacter sp. ANC 4654]|uniref:restriction endonuclease subunit S n=1 Tax=Acinetobacter sp. ANC 4654 TaxID=1977872 RepID=UPI000A34F7F8|nr:restriction endonuclease subunit S [Acinetobacter sp. ANC 4654]OTG96019.1 type I restriction endonuclease subunit R [Acinetobacter sp. ANC 4654]
MTIPVQKLSTFCKTGSGGTPSRSNNNFFENGTIPWVKSGELKNRYITEIEEYITDLAIEKSSAKLVAKGSLLIAMYGATVGEVSQLTFDATTNQAICNILPDENICDVNYLYRFLEASKPYLLSRRVGGGQPNISQGIIKDLEIPLPPLSEQRRIASILDKVDELRQKRQQAIAKLDQLLQATFIDMFGDPVSNPKGWNIVKVGNIVDEFIGGKNVECPDESDSPYKILKVSAVTSKVYKSSESKIAPNGFVPNNLAIVKKGDLLFSRANTTELVAATAYIWQTPDNIVLPDKLWKFSISDEAKVNKLYLWDLFKNTEFRNELSKLSSGTSGSMKNISKGKLNELKMPLPPKELQEKFAEISTKLWSEIEIYKQSSDTLEKLFKSIQNKAFSGTL